MHRPRRFALPSVVLLLLSLLLAACTSPRGDDKGSGGDSNAKSSGSDRLKMVQDRGKLVCGVNQSVPGFGFLKPDGSFSGFDIDFCRVIAAAVLGDAGAVEFKPLTADARFPALQTGEIDVLVRNTTMTAGRDGEQGATFATPTFYDGQGLMVKASSQFKKLQDLKDTAICVLQGTTTEQNLAAQFGAKRIPYEPRSFQDLNTLQGAFIEGRCDVWTADKSALAGTRSNWPAEQGGPAGLLILPDTLSKEPLAPAVRDGDAKWAAAVDWAVLATIQAEEFGLTQANVDQMRSSATDPDVKRFLGLPPAEGSPVFDPKLGLAPDFNYKVVKLVGSYAEIYERNVGSGTPLGLARGPNALWTNGGLLYAPPYKP